MVNDADIQIVIGDTEKLQFEILKNDVPFDLTGYTARFIIALSPDETPIYNIAATNQIDESVPIETGIIYVKLTAEITSALIGKYWYSLQLFDSNNERKTFKSGYLTGNYGV